MDSPCLARSPMEGGYSGQAGQTSGGPPNFTPRTKWVVLPKEPVLIRPGGCRGAGGHVQLDEDVAHVPIDRLLTQEQLAGDGFVGLTRGDEQQYLEFARAETVRVKCGV